MCGHQSKDKSVRGHKSKEASIHALRETSCQIIVVSGREFGKKAVQHLASRCTRHGRCSISMGREQNTLPHAGHRSSFARFLAMALCPWARALWVCLAFSLMKTRRAGNSARNTHERSTIQMQRVSHQLVSQLKLSIKALPPTGVTRNARQRCQSMHGS